MSLKNKVALLAGGNCAASGNIARMLLNENAVVVVPARSTNDLVWAKEFEKEKERGSLITFLADYPDFYKAIEILDDIKERYGDIDISIVCFESPAKVGPLLSLDITEWERMVEQDITAFFDAVRLTFQAVKAGKPGLMITIDNTPFIKNKIGAKLAHLSKYIQKELAKIFYEETKETGLTYHHLYIDDFTKSNSCRHKNDQVRLEDIGKVILKLCTDNLTAEAV